MDMRAPVPKAFVVLTPCSEGDVHVVPALQLCGNKHEELPLGPAADHIGNAMQDAQAASRRKRANRCWLCRAQSGSHEPSPARSTRALPLVTRVGCLADRSRSPARATSTRTMVGMNCCTIADTMVNVELRKEL